MNSKKMQRCLALLLTVCMVMGLFAGTAGAAETAASEFTASATETVSVVGGGDYPVTFTLSNPTKNSYSITLKKNAGDAALTYRGTGANNGTITMAAFTQQEISGYLTFAEGADLSNDVTVDVMSGETVLDTVSIGVIGLDVVKGASYTFDTDEEGWTGTALAYQEANDRIYIAINGSHAAAAATVLSPDELELTSGNLYRLDFTLQGVKVFDQEMGARAMVCDYDADGNALTHPYSLNQQVLLDGTEQSFSCYFVANSLGDESYAYSKISFCARSDAGSYTYRQQMGIDDVVLMDAGAAEAIELPNGDFETLSGDGFSASTQGFTNWTTTTAAGQGTTTKCGTNPDTGSGWVNEAGGRYIEAYEGEEMLALFNAGDFVKYNSTSFTTGDQIVINAWIRYVPWRNMGTPTFTLHVSERDSGGNSTDQTIATTIFCYSDWMNIQGVYTKPGDISAFHIGVNVTGTEYVGTFVDHMTIHKSAAATGLAADQINAQIPGFSGDASADSGEIELTAPVVTELEKPEVTAVTITDTGRSLSLDDIVYIRQYAKITTELTQEYIMANGGLLVWNSEPAEADIATADDVQEGLVYDDYYGEYTQTTDGIATKQFADELYLAIYVQNEDGSYTYGPVSEYSVQKYCEGRLANSTNEKMKALAAAMLHYGAAAQTYFNYNTGDLANANIAAEHPADEWDASLLNALVPYTTALKSTGDVESTGKSLALEGQAVMNCYFKADTTSEIVSGELQVWDSATNLTEYNMAYAAEMTYDDYYGEWVGTTEGFVAKEYARTIFFRAVLTDAEGNVHVSDIITSSPEEYASGRIANSTNAKMVELAKHLVMYGERARLYFDAPEVPEISDGTTDETAEPLDPTTPVDPVAESDYLVYGNEARAHIMLTENATELEVMAAEELQSHVELVTGATLPITTVDPAEGAFTAEADPAVVYAAEDNYYPVRFILRNPSDNDRTVTLYQRADAAETEPVLTVRGDSGNDGTVTVKAQSQVVVTGQLAVEDVFAYAPCTIEVDVVENGAIVRTAAFTFAGRGNAVENGGFEDGSSWSNSSVVKNNYYTGSASMRIIAGKEAVYNTDLQMIPGHMYMLSFYGKSSVDGNVLMASVCDYDASGAALPVPMSMNRSHTVNTTGWSYFEHRFLANTASDADYACSKLKITASGSGMAWVDDVVLVDCGPVEMEEIANGDLETYTTSSIYRFPGTSLHHTCYEDVSTPYSGERAAHMVAGSTGYTHGLISLNAKKEGQTYSVSFWAKAGSNGSTMTMYNDTWVKHSNYGHTHKMTFELTNKWERYEYVWTTPEVATEGDIYNGTYFNFQYTGDIYLDHVHLYAADAAHDLADEMTGTVRDFSQISYTFDSDAEGWSGPVVSASGGHLAIAPNGGTTADNAYAISDDNLKLTTGNMYRLTFKAKANSVLGSAKSGLRVMVCDYDADGNALGHPYSLHEMAILNTAAYQEHTYYFVLNTNRDGAYAYSKLSFNARPELATFCYRDQVYLDDITLTDVGAAAGVEVPNGNFETLSSDGFSTTTQGFTGWITGTLGTQGTTTKCGTNPDNAKGWVNADGGRYIEAYQGNEMLGIAPGEMVKYNSNDYMTKEPILLTAWIRYVPWRNMGEPTFTLHVQEFNSAGESIATHTVGTTIFGSGEWMSVQGLYTKSANAAYFRIGVDVSGTEWVGTFVDHVTIHKATNIDYVPVEKVPGGTMPATAPAIAEPVSNDQSIFIVTPESYPQLADLFADDLTWLGDSDGFSIRKRGGTIYIFGAEVRGTMNGVYDFLEDDMGVIWFRADDTAYVETATVNAPAERREQSPFTIRSWHFGGSGDNGEALSDADTELMISRNKLNGKQTASQNSYCWDYYQSIGLELFQSHHNVVELITKSPLYDSTITEYWNTDENGNYFTSGDFAHNINFWSELTFETAYATVEMWLEQEEYQKYIPISLMDNPYMTQIPYSEQAFEYETGKYVQPSDGNYKSTVFFTWLNRIAARVKQTHPDVKIVTQAYWATETPPACELEDNIYVVFASVAEDVRHDLWDSTSSQNKSIWVDLPVWEEKSQNIIMYHYIGGRKPCSKVEVWMAPWLQTHMQYYAENASYIGMDPEGTVDSGSGKKNWAMNQLTLWLYHKLTWDPYLDMDAYIERFCEAVYGPAAGYMVKYYDLLDQACYATSYQSVYTWTPETAFQNQIANSGLTSQIQSALNNAWNAAPANSIYRDRMEYIKTTFEMMS